jgi:hypothetical protein
MHPALGGRPARPARDNGLPRSSWRPGRATAQGHASTRARPDVPVASAETVPMTATEYDNAVEAIAALIARTWDAGAEAA